MGIPENIKKLREMYNLSQKDLGIIAGVSDKAVSTWEKGLKEPRMGAIQKIADHFGLQKSNIIEDGGLNSRKADLVESPTPQTKKVPKDLKKILEDEEVTLNGRMMSDEDKEKMMRIIEAAFYEAKEMNKRK
jgi:transcriptional regulator with XRE-family HTH domain